MEDMIKVLYIGAKLKIDYIYDFPNASEFVFVDTLPRSSWDHKKFVTKLYDNIFINSLNANLRMHGFTLTSQTEIDPNYYKKIMTCNQRLFTRSQNVKYINPCLLIYVNEKKNKTIRYYISTNIQYNMNKLLKFDIESADTLMISSYVPSNILMNYFDYPKKLVGYSHTCFKPSVYPPMEPTIIDFLKQNSDIADKYFSEYFLICSETGEGTSYSHFDDFLEHAPH